MTTDLHSEPHEHRLTSARSAAAESSILRAAAELLVEVGFERMSMDGVAERAHASKATIYRHFPDKAALAVAAVAAISSPDELVPDDTGSLRGDLLAFSARMCIDTTGVTGALVAGIMNATRNDDELARTMRARITADKEEVIGEIVQRAKDRGELGPDASPKVAIEVATAVVLQRMLVTGEPLDDAFRTHLIDDIVVPLISTGGSAAPTPRS